MRRPVFVGAALLLAALCACGQSGKNAVNAVPQSGLHGVQPEFTAPQGTTPPARFLQGPVAENSTLNTVYEFQNTPDSAGVQAKMTKVSGMFYGTAHGGGANGYGDVFSFDPTTGKETVLYSFTDGADGWGPEALMTYVNGTLYGTTSNVPEPGFPDNQGNGAVWAMSTSGSINVLHSFTGSPDGANPEGFVIEVNGLLYGTTLVGGTSYRCGTSSLGCGTVYTVDPSTGAEKVLYKFKGAPDCAAPRNGLVELDGKLYGGAYYGGKYNEGCVFSITTGGTEKVIHSFAGGSDGKHPQSALTPLGGKLYGTTNQGGGDDGAVYSITTTGVEHVIASVPGGPEGGVIPIKGVLYGTVSGDGSPDAGGIFSVTTSGVVTSLYQFTGGHNGGSPEAAISYLNGEIYGTTRLSGDYGVGTIFELAP